MRSFSGNSRWATKQTAIISLEFGCFARVADVSKTKGQPKMMKVCSEYNCTTPFCPMPRLVRSACGYSLAECLQFSESKLQRQPLHLHCSLALQSSSFKATHFFSHHLSGFFEPPIILVVWHPPTAAWCITPSSSAPRSGRNATVTRSKLQSKAARMDGKVSQTAVFWESPESQSA